MKEYDLKEYEKSNLPASVNLFGKLKKFFSVELSEKQEKVLSDVKTFWTNEIDFSEFKEFWHQAFKLTKFNLFNKNVDKALSKDDNQL